MHKTKITAIPNPMAVSTLLDTAKKEHIPKKKLSNMFSIKTDVINMLNKLYILYMFYSSPFAPPSNLFDLKFWIKHIWLPEIFISFSRFSRWNSSISRLGKNEKKSARLFNGIIL